jgi:hypothetical protein
MLIAELPATSPGKCAFFEAQFSLSRFTLKNLMFIDHGKLVMLTMAWLDMRGILERQQRKELPRVSFYTVNRTAAFFFPKLSVTHKLCLYTKNKICPGK